MKKIIMLLGAMLFMVACEKDNENIAKGDAKVEVTVYDENGKKLSDVLVKMYDEKDYPRFEKNNLTSPTTSEVTDAQGVATFTFSQEKWFTKQSQRFLTFVVMKGGGPDNFEIWSAGRTLDAGKLMKIELRLD